MGKKNTSKLQYILVCVLLIVIGDVFAQANVGVPSKYQFIDTDKNDTITIAELQFQIQNTFSNPNSSKELKSLLNSLALVSNKNTGIVEFWNIEVRTEDFLLANDSTYNYAWTIIDSTKAKAPIKGGIVVLRVEKKLNGDIEYYKGDVLVFTEYKADKIAAEKESALDAGGEAPDPRENFFNVSGAVTGIGQNYSKLKTERVGDGALAQKGELQLLSLITLSTDFTLWKGSNINLSPEVAVGNGVGDGAGLASYPNALFGFPQQKPYLVRAQIQQKFDMPNRAEKKLQSITLSAGRIVIQEMFDVNPYANDPRHDFLNFMHNMQGAWDASTTAYGYAHGAAFNLTFPTSMFNFAAVTVNEEAGGPTVDKNYRNGYSLNAQFVQNFSFKGKEGAVRFFVFMNRAKTGLYDAYQLDSSGLANFEDIRDYRAKVGGYIDANYNLAKGVGLFARASWNDGKSESWGYTQADFSANAGLLCNPTFFAHNNDLFGVTASYNTISKGHQNYLAAGGGNFMIANNQLLEYAPEIVFEVFYSFNLVKDLFITPDYQFLMNPGYDASRGNTHVFALRVNADF